MMLDLMDSGVGIRDSDPKSSYKNTMQNCCLKGDILTSEMMTDLRKPIKNNESVNVNAGTHDEISQDKNDADNMEFSSDTEAIIIASDIFSSEDGGTQNQMPSEFDERVNYLGVFMKELNIKDLKTNAKDCPMIKYSLIGLELSDSDIETVVQTWSIF